MKVLSLPSAFPGPSFPGFIIVKISSSDGKYQIIFTIKKPRKFGPGKTGGRKVTFIAPRCWYYNECKLVANGWSIPSRLLLTNVRFCEVLPSTGKSETVVSTVPHKTASIPTSYTAKRKFSQTRLSAGLCWGKWRRTLFTLLVLSTHPRSCMSFGEASESVNATRMWAIMLRVREKGGTIKSAPFGV